MRFSRNDHCSFLSLELKTQNQKYNLKINNSAISMLERHEIYVAQFIKLENGELILKFRNERGIPRKGEHLTAVLLSDEKRSYKNWSNISWAKLRKHFQVDFTDSICVWHRVSKSSMFSIAGFRGVTLDFADKLVNNCLITLGPKEPPTKYLENLITLVQNNSSNSSVTNILDIDFIANTLIPLELNNNKNIQDTITQTLSVSRKIIIQGPPGTGKTYQMSKLSSMFLSSGKTVLILALTNRALMEFASKDALMPFLLKNRVHKTNLTADEQRELPKLQNTKEIICKPGNISLATFYVASDFANTVSNYTPFDYVIMDEASQSLLAMFGASVLLGKNIIWIGDPYQLPPIVSINEDIIVNRNYQYFINGMNSICRTKSYPFYQLTETYRLQERATQYTGLFYKNNLTSVAPSTINLEMSNYDQTIVKFLNPNGGPTLIKMKLEKGNSIPKSGIEFIVNIVCKLQNTKKHKLDIAILTKFVKTVKSIQKAISSHIGFSSNILVETVERIQGLTNDLTIYFIPNKSISFSLNRALFNVATSRSRGHVLIILDPETLLAPNINTDVKEYLNKLDNEFSFDIDINKMVF